MTLWGIDVETFRNQINQINIDGDIATVDIASIETTKTEITALLDSLSSIQQNILNHEIPALQAMQQTASIGQSHILLTLSDINHQLLEVMTVRLLHLRTDAMNISLKSTNVGNQVGEYGYVILAMFLRVIALGFWIVSFFFKRRTN